MSNHDLLEFEKFLRRSPDYMHDMLHSTKLSTAFRPADSDGSVVIVVEKGYDGRCYVPPAAEQAVTEFLRTPAAIERRGWRKKAKRKKMRPVRKVEYHRYIKSEQWRDRSHSCMARAGYKCEVCDGTMNLEAHHYNYLRLGAEHPDDLFCLCRRCHMAYHRKHDSCHLPQDVIKPREDRLRHLTFEIVSSLKSLASERLSCMEDCLDCGQ